MRQASKVLSSLQADVAQQQALLAQAQAGVRGTQVLPLINSDAQTMRVEAGPGTGKTFGLVRRVERILHPEGLAAQGRDVLVVAFNRVIANNFYKRSKPASRRSNMTVSRRFEQFTPSVFRSSARSFACFCLMNAKR